MFFIFLMFAIILFIAVCLLNKLEDLSNDLYDFVLYEKEVKKDV